MKNMLQNDPKVVHLCHLNSLGNIQPGFVHWYTELINLQCHQCPQQYYCLLLRDEEVMGWYVSDLPKVPTMIDLTGTQTLELRVIESMPYPTLAQ